MVEEIFHVTGLFWYAMEVLVNFCSWTESRNWAVLNVMR